MCLYWDSSIKVYRTGTSPKAYVEKPTAWKGPTEKTSIAKMTLGASNSASVAGYEYSNRSTPDTIRLLTLQPCKETQADQQLKCELEVVSLSDNPSFAALSFTWGKDVFLEVLICENQVLKITKNLHDALIRFVAM
jgi:hypothetical protein